jgi:alcohol dehydrogenase
MAFDVGEIPNSCINLVVGPFNAFPPMTLAYAIGRRGNPTICAGLPPHDATFPVRPAEMVSDERVIMGSYMGSSMPQRDA